MTTIRTTCDVCGDVELDPVEIVVVSSRGSSVDRTHYAFVHCDGIQIRPSSRRTSAILLASGSQTIDVR